MKSKGRIGLIALIIIILILVIVGVTIFMITKKDKDSLNNENNLQESKTEQTIDENTNQDADSNELNTSNKLEKVNTKDYTTVTYGKYDSLDRSEMPIGSKISAYPLDIKEVFLDKYVTIEYGDLYKSEWIVVTGYVHYQKEGFFVVSPSNSENVEEFVGTIVAEDKNIKSDYNWNIKDGDYITIAGLCKGAYGSFSSEENYIVMNDVFIVE